MRVAPATSASCPARAKAIAFAHAADEILPQSTISEGVPDGAALAEAGGTEDGGEGATEGPTDTLGLAGMSVDPTATNPTPGTMCPTTVVKSSP